MGVLLMHPGIRMPDELLPDLRGNTAVRQLGHKGVPQGMEAFTPHCPAFADALLNSARDSCLLNEEPELI